MRAFSQLEELDGSLLQSSQELTGRGGDLAEASRDDSLDASLDESFGSASNEWVVALCSISFDLDVGQHVDDCYPPDSLTAEEQKDIAFHAFPDSMSMELHSKSSIRDSIFFFRVKRRGVQPSSRKSPPEGALSPGRNAKPSGAEECDTYLYGHVFCRQRQDSSLRRGGEQRSVVVVSCHPYTSVLKPLSQVAGPLYFSYGLEALVQVYSDTCVWPAPSSGTLMQLPVGGLSTISAATPSPALLPANGTVNCEQLHPIALATKPDEFQSNGGSVSAHDVLSPSEPRSSESPGQGLFGDMDLYSPLKAVLPKAWTLWEMALVGEPLLVVAPSPSESSETVAAITSMIAPLPYAGDFRPYFTIHDPQFSQLVSGLPLEDSSPRVLGVTNLYILKVLVSDWRNVLAVGEKPTATQASSPGLGFARQGQPESNGGFISNALRALRRRQQGPLQLMAEHCQMLWANYQAITRPDQNLLLCLRDIPAGTDSVKAARVSANNSSTLRRHFEELTTALLLPFRKYISPELPPERGELPANGPPALPIFDVDDWLSLPARHQAEHIAPILLERLGSPRAVAELYRRFVRGVNFMPWLRQQQASAARWRDQEWEAAAALRRTHPIACMDEVQLVEALYSLERRLEAATAACQGAEEDGQVEQLRQELFDLFESMPMDLQRTLLSSPARAAMLQGLLIA